MPSLVSLLVICVMVTAIAGLHSLHRRFWSRRQSALLKYGNTKTRVDGSRHGDHKEKTTENKKHHVSTPTTEPLPNFDWKTTPPAKLRPFKPKYHITMALQATDPSDLILIDSNYLDRVTARRQIIADHTPAVLGTTPAGHAPVTELYSYLLGEYLPTRYPSMFELVRIPNHDEPNPKKTATLFRNKITNLTFPLDPPPQDPLQALQILGETVEDDLFLVLRDRGDDGGPGGEHRAVAFVSCHPSGFAPAEKLGKKLVDIHGPVPAYDKIGVGMERLFGRLAVGKGVKRVNWAVQTHPRLFAPTGNHIYAGDAVEEEEDIDVDSARFRVELQTLTRLPETQAILFSFKTYMYPLAEIKAEGLGSQLAEAIEGLKTGNAPGMWVYKGAARWGRAVCDYLRS